MRALQRLMLNLLALAGTAFYGACDSETKDASDSTSQMDTENCADCGTTLSCANFVESVLEDDGSCSFGKTMEVCFSAPGGEVSESPVRDHPGCGVLRGYPVYHEESGAVYTGLSNLWSVEEKVKACNFTEEGISGAPECQCLCIGTSDSNIETITTGLAVDHATGLKWSFGHKVFDELSSEEFSTACSGASISSDSGWRGPTIEELRGLIRGCENTETEGSCSVDSTCLEAACLDETCEPCEPIPHTDRDCYMPRELGAECGPYWSATHSPDGGSFWIDFTNGGINLSRYTGNLPSVMNIACVKNAP